MRDLWLMRVASGDREGAPAATALLNSYPINSATPSYAEPVREPLAADYRYERILCQLLPIFYYIVNCHFQAHPLLVVASLAKSKLKARHFDSVELCDRNEGSAGNLHFDIKSFNKSMLRRHSRSCTASNESAAHVVVVDDHQAGVVEHEGLSMPAFVMSIKRHFAVAKNSKRHFDVLFKRVGVAADGDGHYDDAATALIMESSSLNSLRLRANGSSAMAIAGVQAQAQRLCAVAAEPAAQEALAAAL